MSYRPVMGAPDDTPQIHGLIDSLEELERQNKKLREALEGYHNLAPAVAEIVNESGEALLYSDLHAANQKAEEALGA